MAEGCVHGGKVNGLWAVPVCKAILWVDRDLDLWEIKIVLVNNRAVGQNGLKIASDSLWKRDQIRE